MNPFRIYSKIDTGAIAHNIKLIKSRIKASRLMIIVKADAYGHGSVAISELLKEHADYFAVAELGEALELRARGIENPILILGYTPPSLYEKAIENNISLTIFSAETADFSNGQ